MSKDLLERPLRQPGDPKKGYKRGISGIFECAFCKTVTTRDYVASEGVARRLGQIQTAVVVEGSRSRIYLPPEVSPVPSDIPAVDNHGLDSELSANPRDVWCRNFGLLTPAELFTPRQLVALTTFSDLVGEARERVLADAHKVGIPDDGKGLHEGGTGATAYADAVATYLAFGLSKATSRNCTLAIWETGMDRLAGALGRQALPMTWDFAETK